MRPDRVPSRCIRAEVLDAQSLAEAEPNLRAGLAGGLRVPDDAVIYPPCAVRFLLERAVARGAIIHTDSEIIELGENGEVLLADGTSLAAGLIVNAAGCSSPELTADVPVRKRKGHLVITDRYSGFIRHELVELGYLKSAHAVATDSVAFNIQPRKTGQMLIGSSRQFDVDDTKVEAGILGRMLRRAQEYLPSIGGLSAIRAWAGHRPATPDKLPLIGPSIASDRVWLATGHEGLGITTSLGTGRLLADLLLARPTVIPAEPYSPRRLARLRRNMSESVTIHLNGASMSVPTGISVAAAIAMAGQTAFRRSVHGEGRSPLCGMGVCFECRVTIDGQPHRRSCITVCREGMEVQTDG